jgi:hypothetical protein
MVIPGADIAPEEGRNICGADPTEHSANRRVSTSRFHKKLSPFLLGLYWKSMLNFLTAIAHSESIHPKDKQKTNTAGHRRYRRRAENGMRALARPP